MPGYFLINSAERYLTLRKLFRMNNTSGFCPQCLAEVCAGVLRRDDG